MTALGRQIDLGEVRHPLFLLAARDDELVAPEQLMAVRRLVGTQPKDIESIVEPCGHLGLFIGATSLENGWSSAARWLAQSSIKPWAGLVLAGGPDVDGQKPLLLMQKPIRGVL